MKKKCPREGRYQGDKSDSLETWAVETTAAKREHFFSTKRFREKYILLEVEIQQMVPGVKQRKGH